MRFLEMSEDGKIYISKYNEFGKFHHSSFLSGQSIAAAGEIKIDNGIIKRSGDEFEGNPIFDSYKVDKQGNIDVDGAWSREWDTEYVMLSEIAKSKGAVKGGKYPKVTGEIIISSELPYCVSCQGVIQDFSDMFPNLDVILIDGLR
ncbi:deaminase domain-containing protein [Aquimarina algiphila]|uniref:deaminase domain-containing protein n=1 Tax=Aquimarina algiphila TaxID=2047982 RepID=UPI00232F5C88|nr:deaminase domain-containing protein [Aquimarina algiphila]